MRHAAACGLREDQVIRIHYVTGSRADFGLMLKTLQTLNRAPAIDLGIVVTGQHTVPKYGQTSQDVVDSGLSIVSEIPVSLAGAGGHEMGYALADELAGMLRLWQNNRPDLVLLLGDRGEMLAAALAAVHLGIHVGHIHGGERSGTLDESFRHAISKLSHLHFAATGEAKDRLVRMGEMPANIHVIGAPGLVDLSIGVGKDRGWLAREFGLPADVPFALTVFHPVVQEAADAAFQIRALLGAVEKQGYAQLVLRPNSDAGGADIDRYLDSLAGNQNLCLVTHLRRDQFCRALSSVDLMIGNSSSGIIESASFGVPCVNLGNRQNNRQRNNNTVDCHTFESEAIGNAIKQAEALPQPFTNVYGDGSADRNLLDVLQNITLTQDMLSKLNAY